MPLVRGKGRPQTFISDSSLLCNTLLNSWTSCCISESVDSQPKDSVSSVVSDRRANDQFQIAKMGNRTNRRVGKRSVSCRTRAGVPEERSLLDVDLLLGFGKQPG